MRSTLDVIGLGYIELQHWMSEINNDIRRDTDQNNKRQHNENSKQWKITNVRITIVKLPVPATE